MAMRGLAPLRTTIPPAACMGFRAMSLRFPRTPTYRLAKLHPPLWAKMRAAVGLWGFLRRMAASHFCLGETAACSGFSSQDEDLPLGQRTKHNGRDEPGHYGHNGCRRRLLPTRLGMQALRSATCVFSHCVIDWVSLSVILLFMQVQYFSTAP